MLWRCLLANGLPRLSGLLSGLQGLSWHGLSGTHHARRKLTALLLCLHHGLLLCHCLCAKLFHELLRGQALPLGFCEELLLHGLDLLRAGLLPWRKLRHWHGRHCF